MSNSWFDHCENVLNNTVPLRFHVCLRSLLLFLVSFLLFFTRLMITSLLTFSSDSPVLFRIWLYSSFSYISMDLTLLAQIIPAFYFSCSNNVKMHPQSEIVQHVDTASTISMCCFSPSSCAEARGLLSRQRGDISYQNSSRVKPDWAKHVIIPISHRAFTSIW